MTPETASETPEAVPTATVEIDESIVAAAALTSEQSWDILRELYVQCSQKAMHTEGFVIPVLGQLEVLKTKLSDPDGFIVSFKTLLGDIRAYNAAANALLARHKDHTGVPSETDRPEIFQISMEYSQLLAHFDGVITPLIFSLIDTLQAEHGDILEVPTAETVA